jgi:acetoin utilization protein AcuB
MLVKNWMAKTVITVDANASMLDAINLQKKHHIRMLPVMDKDRLVGIVTDRDLRSASASDASALEIHELLYLISKIKIKDIMTANPITVPLDYTMEETAEILLEHKISGAPVIDHEGRIMGAITQTDILRALIALTGLTVGRGIQFAMQIEDKPSTIKTCTDILAHFGGHIASILSSYEHAPQGYRRMYIRASNIDRSRLPEIKEALSEKAVLLYIIDHRENNREIF